MPRTSNVLLSSASGRERLVLERFQRGWSQQELADRLGTTPLNVSRWERRLTTPSPYFRRRLVALFGVMESELDLLPARFPEMPASMLSAVEEPGIAFCIDPTIPLSPFGLPLVGREQELVQLRERLMHIGRGGLLALTGLPGVGKTAVAAALAQDQGLQEVFANGILWASLGPEAHLEELLSHWGRLLGVSESEAREQRSQGDWMRTVRRYLRGRRMLLILDDAWRIADVVACQLGGPDCSYLLTTRSPLLARHTTIDGTFALKELEEEQGLELLGRLAPEAVHLEPEQTYSLVKLAGGLPLALVLMGNYLRVQGYSGQPRRIRAALHELEQVQNRLQISWLLSPLQAWKAEPLSLQSVIMTSERCLLQEARVALRALSVFPARPGSFTEVEALSVCQQSVEVLDLLSDAGLLESVGEGRYTLHQTIVDYARAQLANFL